MAIRITRIDDIDGTDGAEAITLSLDDTAYEIDLCPRNKARLLRVIRPFIERARLIGEAEDGQVETNGLYVAPVTRPADNLGSGGLDLIEMAQNVQD